MDTITSLEQELARFLYHEAELLDDRAFDDWLTLLSPDIDYRIPVRTTRYSNEGSGFSSRAFFMKEDLGTLKLRVARLRSEFAWSENPPSRTRRIIGNVRHKDQEGAEGEYAVRSNIAVFLFRGEATAPLTLTGERRDILVVGQDRKWKLKRRMVLLDTTILGLESLSIFL